MKHVVVYGGHYGSEGKASAAEYWLHQIRKDHKQVVVVGENSPNSGHTCSIGATKNIPATSFFADAIVLGPDAVIDKKVLLHDWEVVGKKPLFIHEHAALLDSKCKGREIDLVNRISSTGSGSGMARRNKFIERKTKSVVRGVRFPKGIEIVTTDKYWGLVKEVALGGLVFECSQGVLLDTNFGRFPFVTSRSTLPRIAVERNGLGWVDWTFAGVYRTYPIRTGGPSGPTGGRELTWEGIGVSREIATVTKRIRRVFAFSTEDFIYSMQLSRPDVVMFTFLDYLGVSDLNELSAFTDWLYFYQIQEIRRLPVYVSNSTGKFVEYHRVSR